MRAFRHSTESPNRPRYSLPAACPSSWRSTTSGSIASLRDRSCSRAAAGGNAPSTCRMSWKNSPGRSSHTNGWARRRKLPMRSLSCAPHDRRGLSGRPYRSTAASKVRVCGRWPKCRPPRSDCHDSQDPPTLIATSTLRRIVRDRVPTALAWMSSGPDSKTERTGSVERKDSTIVAWMKPSCGWSNGVRAVFGKYGLEYEDKDIINYPENFYEMVMASGQQYQPCVEIDGVMLADVSGRGSRGLPAPEGHRWAVQQGHRRSPRRAVRNTRRANRDRTADGNPAWRPRGRLLTRAACAGVFGPTGRDSPRGVLRAGAKVRARSLPVRAVDELLFGGVRVR